MTDTSNTQQEPNMTSTTLTDAARPNFPTKLDPAAVREAAREAGAGFGAIWQRGANDATFWGSAAAVRRTLCLLGLGFDTPRTGKIQRIHDLDGQAVGAITYGAKGASARLCNAFADFHTQLRSR